MSIDIDINSNPELGPILDFIQAFINEEVAMRMPIERDDTGNLTDASNEIIRTDVRDFLTNSNRLAPITGGLHANEMDNLVQIMSNNIKDALEENSQDDIQPSSSGPSPG
jgi:hypothetical protein